MYSVFSTYLLYNSLLFICPILCFFNKKTNIFFAYFIIAIVSVLRYDIGADYESYAEGIEEIVQWLYSGFSLPEIAINYDKEPGILLLAFIFSWSDFPYIWFVGIVSVMNTFLLYKVLERYHFHTWGIFVYILAYIMFQGWDWIRQSVAMHVFLYSLRYIELKNLKKYIICILCASLFHYSSLCLLPLYFIDKIKFSQKMLLCFSVGIFLFAEFGGFNGVYQLLELIAVFYSEDYNGSDHIYAGANTYHTTTYIFTMLWYISILAFYPQKGSRLILFSYFVGIVLYTIAGGNLLLIRISYYFTSLQIILFPFIIQECKQNIIKKILIIVMLVGQFAIFNRVYIGGNFRGCTPYESIFSKNCSDKQFRYRDY